MENPVIEPAVEEETTKPKSTKFFWIVAGVIALASLILTAISVENARDYELFLKAIITAPQIFGIWISIVSAVLLTIQTAKREEGIDHLYWLVPLIAGLTLATQSSVGLITLGVIFIAAIILEIFKRKPCKPEE